VKLTARLTTLAERRARGRRLRKVIRRVDQAHWSPAKDRPDPVTLIQESNAERLTQLVPIKMARMAASPFGFFRGAAPVMAADLAQSPTTGLRTDICGDAHVRNLGAFAGPDGHLVFDLNDFDETTRGPWEWDLKRLATSLVLAGREAGGRDKACAESVGCCVRAYRQAMDLFSQMPIIDLARYRIKRLGRMGAIASVLHKAERVTPLFALEKLTQPAKGGLRQFTDKPPLLYHVPSKAARAVVASLASYRETLGPSHQHVVDSYHAVDVAFKVVGTGSVGTRDYVVLLFGGGLKDPLFLQVKEEVVSCYARYLPDVPPVAHQGRRVAEGQHRMQTVSDFLLGWTSIDGRDYLVRQLADHKASVDPAALKGAALLEYALVCGEVLAKSHARTGDAAGIAGYCGKSTKLDQAITRFARAYADQTTDDHARLRRAIRAGRIKAARSGA